MNTLDEFEATIENETDVQVLIDLSLRLSMLMNKATRRYQDLSVAYYEVFADSEAYGKSIYIGKYDTEDDAHAECVRQMNTCYGGIGQIQGLNYFKPGCTAGDTSVVRIQRMTKDGFWADRL